MKAAPTSSSNTSGTFKNTTTPVKNPIPGSTPTNPVPVNPAPGSTKPAVSEKPKEPWESWVFTGLSEHGSLRFAIIETPENAYIVKEGDRIEGIWLVEYTDGVSIRNHTGRRFSGSDISCNDALILYKNGTKPDWSMTSNWRLRPVFPRK